MAEAVIDIIDSMKICKKCGAEKSRAEFGNSKFHKDGLMPRCRGCVAEKNKAAYAKHAEKRREYAKEYGERNKEGRAAYGKKYREVHREELGKYIKEWRQTHTVVRSEESKRKAREAARKRYKEDPTVKEKLRAYNLEYRKNNRDAVRSHQREYYKKNRQKFIDYHKSYYKTWKTPEEMAEYSRKIRLKHRHARQVAQLRYNTKRYGSEGEITNVHLYNLHKWQDHCCFHCRSQLNGKDTMDHLVPCIKEGTNNPYNIVLACSFCNTSKCAKLLHLEWRPRDIQPAPRWHSIHCHSIIHKMAIDRGLPCETDDSFVIVNSRHIAVASTFWCQALPNLPAEGATIFLDHEFLTNPEMVFDEALQDAGLVVLTKRGEQQQLFSNGAGIVAYRKEDMAINLDWFDASLDDLTIAKVNGLLHISTT